MYGQTECKRTCYLPPEQLDTRPGSVGIPIPGTQVYIVDEDGKPVPPGLTGELVVQGPHLMRGYWERPEETAKRLRPGPNSDELMLYTGDLFRMDTEGYLYFVSREDDIIKSRGEKVSPNEIENSLYGLDAIADVAAVGVPDEILGEAIKVYVVLRDGTTLTERDVRAHCARHLEDFMVPKYVEFRTELPKSGNGKTMRRELKACVA
jgi:acyl-coenzyme A synthetase/AMP-(fatty) acid ligase